MFDSNRNRDNILFKKEFDDWADMNKNLKIVYLLVRMSNNNRLLLLQMIGEENTGE